MILILNSLIVALLAIYSNCAKLVPIVFSSTKFSSNYWNDLIDQEIRCPNNGVIKNFVLRKSNKEYYFDLQCYSSDKEEIDYGEPIIKRVNYTISLEANLYNYRSDISSINSLEMDCSPDYGLNGFQLYKERYSFSREVLKKAAFCKPTKSSYVSRRNLQTKVNQVNTMNLDCFVDIVVGRTDTENEEDIGYPLRSFQFKVEGTSSIKRCYYIYSYQKLKNMGKLRDERLKQMEELRNKNTQVD